MEFIIHTKEDGPVEASNSGECMCGTRVRRSNGQAYELVSHEETIGWERHDCQGVQLTITELGPPISPHQT